MIMNMERKYRSGPGITGYGGRYSDNIRPCAKKILPAVRIITSFILLFLFAAGTTPAQTVVDKKNFFSEEELVRMTLVTDLKKLVRGKEKKNYEQNSQPATITFYFPDSSKVTEEAEIRSRGEFRREECHMPPIMVNFKTSQAVSLKKLGRLKFVWPCDNTMYYEQLVLKEYLVYRIYNLLTEKSLRVRLVKVEYRDAHGWIKPRITYGFFIEDVDDMAKRNDCMEVDLTKFYTEQTNREHTTMVALFQYMIGNTDWAPSVYHNIKLILPRRDSLAKPFMVPYDFDCNGLVNADYAVPPPELGITTVRQRLYRGFPRTLQELQEAMLLLNNRRKAIDSLIMNCVPLSRNNKKEMMDYLGDFYKATQSEEDIKELFIRGARRD
jgi:hypothetical protein